MSEHIGKTVIVTTNGKSWHGQGFTLEQAVKDAFRKIAKSVKFDPTLKIGRTYSVREEHEPARLAIDGYRTVKMLVQIGELKPEAAKKMGLE